MVKARRNLSGLLLLLLCSGSGGCNQTTQFPTISTDLSRTGPVLEPTSAVYTDDKPVVSDDGTKVVFISGRDSANLPVATLKAYKVSWPAGGTPTAPARVTASEIGIETDARISPDGSWVALLVTTAAGAQDLYIQDFGGTKPAARINDNAAVKGSFAFSGDAKLLAWVDTDATAGTGVAMLLDLTGLTPGAALPAPVKASGASEVVTQLFWGNAASGYQLVTGTAVSGETGHVAFSTRSFATSAAAAAAQPTVWVKDFLPGAVAPVAAGGKVLVIREVLAGDNLPQLLAIGDNVNPQDNPPPLSTATAQAEFLNADGSLTPFKPTQPPAQAPGFDYVAAGLSADGSTAFLLARNEYRCQPDAINYAPVYAFGTGIVTIATTPGAQANDFSPRMQASEILEGTPVPLTFSVASGFCDRPVAADGSKPLVDDQLVDLTVARGGTATKFRAIYVSRFSTYFDSECNLKNADPEVYGMDVGGAANTVVNLSNNPAPTTDDDRGNQPPCKL